MSVGPTVRIEASCFSCVHCTTRGYRVQGDSGNMVYCTHLEIGRRVVGDTRWETPLWCPLLAAAVSSLLGSAVPLNADPQTEGMLDNG
jgi:hypothetical protein